MFAPSPIAKDDAKATFLRCPACTFLSPGCFGLSLDLPPLVETSESHPSKAGPFEPLTRDSTPSPCLPVGEATFASYPHGDTKPTKADSAPRESTKTHPMVRDSAPSYQVSGGERTRTVGLYIANVAGTPL